MISESLPEDLLVLFSGSWTDEGVGELCLPQNIPTAPPRKKIVYHCRSCSLRMRGLCPPLASVLAPPSKSTPATGLAIALMNEKKDLRMFVIQLHSTKNWSSAFWDSYAFGSYYFVIRSIRSRFAFLGRNLIHIRKDGEIRQV